MENINVKNIAFEGQCAFALSLGKRDVKGGNYLITKDGEQYSFSNPLAKLLFKIIPNSAEKAKLNWESQSKN